MTREFDPPLGERIAWKVFIWTAEGLRFPHFRLDGGYDPGQDIVAPAVWLYASRSVARTIRGGVYVTGFHVFPELESALAWSKRRSAVVAPVIVRNVRLEGLHAPERRHRDEPGLRCLVADEMYVSGETLTADDALASGMMPTCSGLRT